MFNDYDQDDGQAQARLILVTVLQVGQGLLMIMDGWNHADVLLIPDDGAELGQPLAQHQPNRNNSGNNRRQHGAPIHMRNANNVLDVNVFDVNMYDVHEPPVPGSGTDRRPGRRRNANNGRQVPPDIGNLPQPVHPPPEARAVDKSNRE